MHQTTLFIWIFLLYVNDACRANTCHHSKFKVILGYPVISRLACTIWKDFVIAKWGRLSQENACCVSLGTEFRSSALTQRLRKVVCTCNLAQEHVTDQSLKLLASQPSWSVRLTADSVRDPASENKVSDEGRHSTSNCGLEVHSHM